MDKSTKSEWELVASLLDQLSEAIATHRHDGTVPDIIRQIMELGRNTTDTELEAEIATFRAVWMGKTERELERRAKRNGQAC